MGNWAAPLFALWNWDFNCDLGNHRRKKTLDGLWELEAKNAILYLYRKGANPSSRTNSPLNA